MKGQNMDGFDTVILRELNEVYIGLQMRNRQGDKIGLAIKQLMDVMLKKKRQTTMLPADMAEDFKQISFLYRISKKGQPK